MDPRRPAGLTRVLEAALHQTCSTAVDMVRSTREAFIRNDPQTRAQVDRHVADLRLKARALTTGILSELGNRPGFATEARELLTLPMHLERMADRGESLEQTIQGIEVSGLPFTDRARTEVIALMVDSLNVLESLRDLVRTWNPVLARHVVHASDRAESLTDECAQEHRDRLVGGECIPMSSPVYLSLLDHLSSIRRHAREMALDLERWTSPPA